MKYFHRTSLPLADVLAEADRFLGGRLAPGRRAERSRQYRGTIGVIDLEVRAEGGHYTLVTIRTDQLAESEADKLAKRFLSTVHLRTEPDHDLRGAY